ncbi:MAG: Trk system potassium transporter TrkA [Christensenella sp.]|nr:MAG: Trk system potassium transporter TrkA [Christensenella sp.]
MEIVISGLGSVGTTLMQELVDEGHNIVVIDINAQKIENAVNKFDVKGVIGNGASTNVLKEAGVQHSDLFIGATNHDELNILCCIIAKKLGAKKTIARASKPEYLDLFKNEGDLGLSLMVNPQYEAALEISRMLRFPSAIKVNEFSNGKVELVEFLVSEDSPLVGLPLKKLGSIFKEKVLICAAQRDDKAIIPTGDFVIQAGDRLFVTATMKHISLFFKHLGWNRQAKDAIIVGGSTTAYYLCKELDKIGIHAKLIEKDPQKASIFSEDFKKINVILGDGTDQELLLEEGLATTDAFVALANMDEQNIIMSMFATSQDVPKVITKIDQLGYYDMLQKSGIYSAVSTKTSTTDRIIRFVRLIGNAQGSTVKRVFHIIDDTTEILEFEAKENFKRFDVPIQQLNLKKHLLVAGIIRKGELITPSGQDVIKLGDNVIIVTLEEGLDDLKDILDF